MFGVNAVTGRGYNPSVSFADSSPYTGEPRSALSSPCGVQGSRGGSAASRRVCLTEHRGAENALHRLCAKFRIPNSEFRITLCRHPFKMCAHGAHTFIFHAPKGRASCAGGVLHAPSARFICKAKNAASAAFFCCSLTYLCKQQCLFRCRGRRAEAHRRI